MRHTLLSLLVVLVTGSGCAALSPRAQSAPSVGAQATAGEPAVAGPFDHDASLTPYLQQVRELSRRARPRSADAQLAEHWSAELAAAMARQSAAPTAGNEVALGQILARLGIADQAHEHFARAARLDPRESAAWDGLARIWRDWGFPHFGLGDAYRAVAADPRSPVARNTLGTILEHLGHGRDARAQFMQTLALDSGAAYAQNNICYSWLMEGRTDAAANACRLALTIEPDLIAARNNLALARAIDGDLAGAAEIFGQVGGESARQYNLGIVYLSQGRYSAAADAFDRAAQVQPAPRLARARAEQARQHVVNAPEGGRDNHERR